MKIKNNGFTLIELLAVIVILAIIALIATPIVLNIIDESKDNASLRSADFYLDAVEMAVANSTLKDKNITDGDYNILSSGNICLEYTNEECTNQLTVEVKGEVPDRGTITITKGAVSAIELVYDEKTIVQNDKGELAFSDTELKYTIGQEVRFNPGDGERTWNVIDEDAQTVTLLLSENLGNKVAWYDYSNYNTEDTSNYGPKDALDYLNSLTIEWDKVDPIKNYSYINNENGTKKPYGYQKIEIKNGVTTLTHQNGETITNVDGVSKARLLTLDEVFGIASKTNTNLTEENLRKFISDNLETVNTILQAQGEDTVKTVDEGIAYVVLLEPWLANESEYMQTYYTVVGMIDVFGINPTHDILLPDYLYENLHTDDNIYLPFGYWTLSSYVGKSFNSDDAWIVYYVGRVNSDDVYNESGNGVRPVITISKSEL